MRPLSLMNTNLVVVWDFKEDRLFAKPMLHVWPHQLWGFGRVFLRLDRVVNVSFVWIGFWLQDLASLCNSDLVRTYSVYSIFVCFDTIGASIYTTLYIVVYSATGWTCLSLHGFVSFVFRMCKNVITDATVLVVYFGLLRSTNQPWRVNSTGFHVCIM